MRRQPLHLRRSVVALLAVELAACAAPGEGWEPAGPSPDETSSSSGVGGFTPSPNPSDLGAPCDPSWSIESDGRALLVRDPEVLSHFALERVLAQIGATGGPPIPPEELLQRLFDTQNTAAGGVFADNTHCDDPDNAAFAHAPAVACPRAEGVLAASSGLFVPDDPDYFAPVALVHRFDLMPSNYATCGEYRIVYAKWSGRSDPTNRVFLAFEAALANPAHALAGCRDVAELLAGLDVGDSDALVERLETFYFTGLPGFAPVVSAAHYGLSSSSCTYATCGQIRLGEGMQAPWNLREFRLRADPPELAPTAVTNSPLAESFDPSVTTAPATLLRNHFLSQLGDLSGSALAKIRMRFASGSEAGESSPTGAAKPNYLERVQQSEDGAAFLALIAGHIPPADAACADEPVTAESVLKRASALTCAGCHAPREVLGADRTIGCGLVWPDSLGQAHIDETGVLSEALTQVFLPRRASVLTTYLQACDAAAVLGNLEPVSDATVECFVAGTPITLADGSTKPIEHVAPGEMVLSFDARTGQLAPAQVVRTVERARADRLVVVNGRVVATANHPFHSAGGWVRAGELEVGSPLFEVRALDPARSGPRFELAPTDVDALLLTTGGVPTYNLEVAEHHAYFAGGFLVHDRP